MTRWVRVDRLAQSGLDADEVIDALTLAVTELGRVLAMTADYGARGGFMRYPFSGGRCRWDQDGTMLVPVGDREGEGHAS